MKNKYVISNKLAKERYHEIDFEIPEDGPTHYTFETNPFTGGEIQRDAHKRGAYDNIDYQQLGLDSWKNKDQRLKDCIPKMCAGYQKWMKENKELFLTQQRKKLAMALDARRLTLEKLEYRGKVYYGWPELEKATGKTKWFLKKDPEVKR